MPAGCVAHSLIERLFYTDEPPRFPESQSGTMSSTYAELHSHTNFSFLHGASPVEDMAGRAAELGLSGLAVTDHDGLYGVVRFATAAAAVGIRPILGVEIELQDAAAPDPGGAVLPARRRLRGRGPLPGRAESGGGQHGEAVDGQPARPRPDRARLPGHRSIVKEDLRGIGERQRGPHLVLLARDAAGYRSLCRLISHANLAGTKRVPRFDQALLATHAEGLIALSGCGEGEIARRLRVGELERLPPASADPRTARAWAEGIATAAEVAASCSVDLGFEQYRFPGFPVPKGETPFSYLSELCWAGARRRYHPLTSAVVNRLAH